VRERLDVPIASLVGQDEQQERFGKSVESFDRKVGLDPFQGTPKFGKDSNRVFMTNLLNLLKPQPGSTALFEMLRLLFFHHANETLERGPRDDAIELRAVVVDHADVFDHKVVDFPFLVDAVEFVVDGQFFALICDDLGIDFGILLVLDLTRVRMV
jgi:hypothetical protein